MSVIYKAEALRLLRRTLNERRQAHSAKARRVSRSIASHPERLVLLEIDRLLDDQAGRFVTISDPWLGVSAEQRAAAAPRARRRRRAS